MDEHFLTPRQQTRFEGLPAGIEAQELVVQQVQERIDVLSALSERTAQQEATLQQAITNLPIQTTRLADLRAELVSLTAESGTVHGTSYIGSWAQAEIRARELVPENAINLELTREVRGRHGRRIYISYDLPAPVYAQTRLDLLSTISNQETALTTLQTERTTLTDRQLSDAENTRLAAIPGLLTTHRENERTLQSEAITLAALPQRTSAQRAREAALPDLISSSQTTREGLESELTRLQGLNSQQRTRFENLPSLISTSQSATQTLQTELTSLTGESGSVQGIDTIGSRRAARLRANALLPEGATNIREDVYFNGNFFYRITLTYDLPPSTFEATRTDLNNLITTQTSTHSTLSTELANLNSRALTPTQRDRLAALPDLLTTARNEERSLQSESTTLAALPQRTPAQRAREASLPGFISISQETRQELETELESLQGLNANQQTRFEALPNLISTKQTSISTLQTELASLTGERDRTVQGIDTFGSRRRAQVRADALLPEGATNIREDVYFNGQHFYRVTLTYDIAPSTFTPTKLNLTDQITTQTSTHSTLSTELANLNSRALTPTQRERLTALPDLISTKQTEHSTLETELSTLQALPRRTDEQRARIAELPGLISNQQTFLAGARDELTRIQALPQLTADQRARQLAVPTHIANTQRALDTFNEELRVLQLYPLTNREDQRLTSLQALSELTPEQQTEKKSLEMKVSNFRNLSRDIRKTKKSIAFLERIANRDPDEIRQSGSIIPKREQIPLDRVSAGRGTIDLSKPLLRPPPLTLEDKLDRSLLGFRSYFRPIQSQIAIDITQADIDLARTNRQTEIATLEAERTTLNQMAHQLTAHQRERLTTLTALLEVRQLAVDQTQNTINTLEAIENRTPQQESNLASLRSTLQTAIAGRDAIQTQLTPYQNAETEFNTKEKRRIRLNAIIRRKQESLNSDLGIEIARTRLQGLIPDNAIDTEVSRIEGDTPRYSLSYALPTTQTRQNMLNQLNNLENTSFEDKRLLHSNIIAQLTHPRMTISDSIEFQVNNAPSRNTLIAKLRNKLEGQLPTGATGVRYRITEVPSYHEEGLFAYKGLVEFTYRHTHNIHQIEPTLQTKRLDAQILQSQVDQLHADSFRSVEGRDGYGSWAAAEYRARQQLPQGATDLVITRRRTGAFHERVVRIDYRLFTAEYRNKQKELSDTHFEIGLLTTHLPKQKTLNTLVHQVAAERNQPLPEPVISNTNRERILQGLIEHRELAISQQTQRLNYLENLRHQSTTLARQQREARDLIKLATSQRDTYKAQLKALEVKPLQPLQAKKKDEEEPLILDDELTDEERTQITKLTTRIDQRTRQLYERLSGLTNPRLSDEDFEQELKSAEKYEKLIEARQADLDAIRLPSPEYLARREEIKTIRLGHKQEILKWRGELKAERIKQQEQHAQNVEQFDLKLAEYNKQLKEIEQQNLEYLLTQESDIRASREVQLADRITQDLARWEKKGKPYEDLVETHRTKSQSYKLKHQARLDQGYELVSERKYSKGRSANKVHYIEYTYKKKVIPLPSAAVITARKKEDTTFQELIKPIDAHHKEQERLEKERNKQAEIYVQSEITRINQKYESIWQQESTTYETQFEQRGLQIQELRTIDTKDSLSAELLKREAADALHKTRYTDMITNIERMKKVGLSNAEYQQNKKWTSTLGKEHEIGALSRGKNTFLSGEIKKLRKEEKRATSYMEFSRTYPNVILGGEWYRRWLEASSRKVNQTTLVQAYKKELTRQEKQREASIFRSRRKLKQDRIAFNQQFVDEANRLADARIQGDILFRRQAEEISKKFGTKIPQVVPGRPNQLFHRIKVVSFSGQEHEVVLPVNPGEFVAVDDQFRIDINPPVNRVDPFEYVDNQKQSEPEIKPPPESELQTIEIQQEGDKPLIEAYAEPTIKEFERLAETDRITIPEGVEPREHLLSNLVQATPKYRTTYDRYGNPIRRITNQAHQQYYANLRSLGGIENTIREGDISPYFLDLQRAVDPDLSFAGYLGFDFTQEAKELVAYGFVLDPEQRELQRQLARGAYTLKEFDDFKNQYKSTTRPDTETLVGVAKDAGVNVDELATVHLEIDGEVQAKTLTIRELGELYEQTPFFNLGLKPLYVEWDQGETAGKYTVYDPQAGEYVNMDTGDNNLLLGGSKLAQALANEGKISLENIPKELLNPQIDSENPFGYSDNERTLMENPGLETWGEYWARQNLTPLEQADLSIKKTGKGARYAFESVPRYVDYTPVSPYVLSEHELLIGDAIEFAVPVVLNTFQQSPQFIPQLFYPIPTNKEEFTPYDVPIPFDRYNRVVATRSLEERIGDWTTTLAIEAGIWVTTRDVGARIKASASFANAMARLKLTKTPKADTTSGKKPSIQAKDDFEIVPSREQPQYVRTLVQTLEKGYPGKVVFVERQLNTKKFLISIGTEGNDVKSPFRVLDFAKPPKTPKGKTPKAESPKAEPTNPKIQDLIDIYDNAPISKVKSTSKEIREAMKTGRAFTQSIPLPSKLSATLKTLKETVKKPILKQVQSFESRKANFEITQRTKPTPIEPKYDTSKYAFDEAGRFGFQQTNKPTIFQRIGEKLTDFQYRAPFNKVVVRKPTAYTIYSYPDEITPTRFKSVFSDIRPEPKMKYDVEKIGKRAYEITPNPRKKTSSTSPKKKSLEDEVPLTPEQVAEKWNKLRLQLINPNFFSQVGKRYEVPLVSRALSKIFTSTKEAESNYDPTKLSLITESKYGTIKKPKDADLGPKHDPKDWTLEKTDTTPNNIIPGAGQSAKVVDDAAKTLGGSGKKQQTKDVNVQSGKRDTLRDAVIRQESPPPGTPVITPKNLGRIKEGVIGGIPGAAQPPPNTIQTPSEIIGERINEGTATGSGEGIREGIGQRIDSGIVQEHQRDLLRDWIGNIDGFKPTPREIKKPKGIKLPKTKIKTGIVAVPIHRVVQKQDVVFVHPEPVRVIEDPKTKGGTRPPPLFFTRQLRKKRVEKERKLTKEFLGNVPISSIVGIYAKKKDITYNKESIRKRKAKELAARKKKKSKFTDDLFEESKTNLFGERRKSNTKDKERGIRLGW